MNSSECSDKLVNKHQCNVINSLITFLKCNYKYKRRFDDINKNLQSFIKKYKYQNEHDYDNDDNNDENQKKFIIIIMNMLPIICHDDVNIYQLKHSDMSTQLLNNNNNNNNNNKDKKNDMNFDIRYKEKKSIDSAATTLACCAQQLWQDSHASATTTRKSTSQVSNNISMSQQPRQISSLAATLSMSTRRFTCKQQTTTTTTTTNHRVNLLPILMTLFIALLWSARAVQAGACWQKAMDSGKCREIYSLNMSREECCDKNTDFSFTERDPTSIEYFFATTVGDGMECTPCVESCKHIICGENKKCIKRNGRPKCICAPECGAAARRRERARKMQQQQQQHHTILENLPIRGIRSLSSEITHFNLGLDAHQNQRKLLSRRSQSQSQSQSQSPQKAITARIPKPKRLIIVDTEEQQKTEKPTTRRFQIFSNVRPNNKHGQVKTSHNHVKLQIDNDVHTTERHHKHQRQHEHNNRHKKGRKKHKIPFNHTQVIPKSNEESTTIQFVSSTSIEGTTYAYNLTHNNDIKQTYNLHGFPQKSTISHFEHMHTSNPVCGTDGRTYNSECQLKKRACRTDNHQLSVAYRGHCHTTCNGVKCLNGLTCVEDQYTMPHCITCKIDCPADDYGYNDGAAVGSSIPFGNERAVCGFDGKTYRSICDINRMICKIGRSIAVAYPGPCREDFVTCADINCGPKLVCLTDLLTHKPRCVSCSYKCPRKHRPSRYEEGKLCGVNNRTYNSWCEMRKDSCATGFFIDVKSAGQCQ